MFKYRTLLILGLLILPVMVQAQTVCPSKPMGKVNVIWGSDKIEYDFKKSQNQLKRMNIDTVSPYDRNAKTHVGGLMEGGIGVEYRSQTSFITYPRLKKVCLWVEKVEIKMDIDPKIYVAREHKKRTCKHNAILDHEMKHIFVDREIVKKYAPLIKGEMEKAVRKVGMVGPKKSSDLKKYQRKIDDYLQARLKNITDKMHAERNANQQGVDTLTEYERVANFCG